MIRRKRKILTLFFGIIYSKSFFLINSDTLLTYFRIVWDDILRFIINEKRGLKEPGKHCWSIHCHDKLEMFSKVFPNMTNLFLDSSHVSIAYKL
jgi:hypothetical protein